MTMLLVLVIIIIIIIIIKIIIIIIILLSSSLLSSSSLLLLLLLFFFFFFFLLLLLLLLLLLFTRVADAAETKTEMVGRFNHPCPHVRDRVHVEFLSEVIEIEKRLLGGLGNTRDAVNVLVIYFVMFPFGNYQKSSQDRQNSRGSPAIRRPDLYSPAEMDIHFLHLKTLLKQSNSHHTIYPSVYVSLLNN